MEPTQKDTKTPKSSSPPWLDLPDPLTELILERLPLLYYLRFSAVCRKWRSIQKAHRLRYSPSPPPMAPSLPWLIGTDLLEDSARVPNCYSPFDQTLHRLRLPSSLPLHYFLASAHGWLLLIHENTVPSSHITSSLLNPITGHHILLPPLDAVLDQYSLSGAISAPPSDPRCALLISIDGDVFLHHRLSDHNKWTRLDFPDSTPISIDNRVLHSSGKFYCVSEGFKLHVIDPFLPVPSLQFIEMDTSLFLPYVTISDFHFKELDGEILILVNAYNPDCDYSEFEGFICSRQIFREMCGSGWKVYVIEHYLLLKEA